MTTKTIESYKRSGIPRGSRVTTERGRVTIENLRVTDKVLTDNQSFVGVKNITKQLVTGQYLLSSHGLDPITLSQKSRVYVRDVELKEQDGQVIPLISWPYWVSIQKVNPSKHLVLSPYNPHSINPYAYLSLKSIPVSIYTDNQNQKWLQVEKIEFSIDVLDEFHVELEEDSGIAVEYITVK